MRPLTLFETLEVVFVVMGVDIAERSLSSARSAIRSKPALHVGVGLTKSAPMKLSTVDLPALNKKIKRGPFYDAILKMGYTGIEMVDL